MDAHRESSIEESNLTRSPRYFDACFGIPGVTSNVSPTLRRNNKKSSCLPQDSWRLQFPLEHHKQLLSESLRVQVRNLAYLWVGISEAISEVSADLMSIVAILALGVVTLQIPGPFRGREFQNSQRPRHSCRGLPYQNSRKSCKDP